MWQRLPAVLQYLFIPLSTKTYHFLSNHTAVCLTVRYRLKTKFWPMRCKYSCVIPLEVSLKEQDALFLTPSSFLRAGMQTRYLKLEKPSWIPWGEATCRGWDTIMREEIWILNYSKMMSYQFWTALFLTFMWEINFYLLKVIIIFLYFCPSQPANPSYQKNKIQGHILQIKHGCIGTGYGTEQPLLVSLDLWGLSSLGLSVN